VAPADSNAEADGDGGGSTMALRPNCGWAVFSVWARGDCVSTPALSEGSEPPSGIWTVSRGPRGREPALEPICRLLEREGGVKVVSGTGGPGPPRLFSTLDWARCNGGGTDGARPFRVRAPASIDCARMAGSDFTLGDSDANEARC
jgi:hypothetical protein